MILCVYMPYECHVNEADYVEKLGALQSILSELDRPTTCVSILGDWIADISDGSSIFAGHLRQFCPDTCDTRFRSRIVRHWLKSLYIHFDGG